MTVSSLSCPGSNGAGGGISYLGGLGSAFVLAGAGVFVAGAPGAAVGVAAGDAGIADLAGVVETGG